MIGPTAMHYQNVIQLLIEFGNNGLESIGGQKMTNKDESVEKTLNQQLKKQTSNKILMIQLNKLKKVIYKMKQ